MVATRPAMQQFSMALVAIWLVGLLCGAALGVGIVTLRSTSGAKVAPGFGAPTGQASGIAGGRLGGVVSADTANDWTVRQSLPAGSYAVQQSAPAVVLNHPDRPGYPDAPSDVPMGAPSAAPISTLPRQTVGSGAGPK